MSVLIANAFEVVGKLGSGAFGDVYEGIDRRTGAHVAIKTEKVDATCPQLIYESRVMRELQTSPGIPRRYWFGKQDDMNILVMQRLGRCLGKDLLTAVDAMEVARQALERLQTLHVAGFAHRDIKPENFVHGVGSNRDTLYIIDFGLCKRVVDLRSGKHIDNRGGKLMTGTPRYASLHTHDGEEQSRRDDVEALVYMLIYLVKGSLPWQGKSSAHNYAAVGKIKRDIRLDELCAGLPPAFEATLAYARTLGFACSPDYGLLQTLWSCTIKK
jgi:serine/threonine protein kinase